MTRFICSRCCHELRRGDLESLYGRNQGTDNKSLNCVCQNCWNYEMGLSETKPKNYQRFAPSGTLPSRPLPTPRSLDPTRCRRNFETGASILGSIGAVALLIATLIFSVNDQSSKKNPTVGNQESQPKEVTSRDPVASNKKLLGGTERRTSQTENEIRLAPRQASVQQATGSLPNLELKVQPNGQSLSVALEASKEDNRVVLVDVQRTYYKMGDHRSYVHGYFSDRSTAANWRQARTIALNHDQWRRSLETRLTKIERQLGKSTVKSVSNEIEISVIVPYQSGVSSPIAIEKVFTLDSNGSLENAIPDHEIADRNQRRQESFDEEQAKLRYLRIGQRPGLMVENEPLIFEGAVDPFSVEKHASVDSTVVTLEKEPCVSSVTTQPFKRGNIAVVSINRRWNTISDSEKIRLAELADTAFHDFRFTDAKGVHLAYQTVAGPFVRLLTKAADTHR